MQKSMTFLYAVKNGLYVNLTNKCPCSCIFCLRKNGDGVYGSPSLWLEREPTASEIISLIDKTDLTRYDEIVFCGYGEPTERLPDLLQIAEHIKKISDIRIRVNTNGLSDLIWGRSTANDFVGKADTLSVSLNATTAEKYQKITRSVFGIESFDALKKFVADAKRAGIDCVLTVVDKVTTDNEQAEAKTIADDLGVRLRVRPLE